MAEQKNDNKPQKFFEVLRKKSKEKLGAFIYKEETLQAEPEVVQTSEPKTELPQHPLYALWCIWQMDQNGPDADIAEETFRAWFGHDIDLEIKTEEDETEHKTETYDEEKEKATFKTKGKLRRDKTEEPTAEDMPVEEKEEPAPEPTPAQLFCDSLTLTAASLVKEIRLEYRLAEAEFRARQEVRQKKAQSEAAQSEKESAHAAQSETEQSETEQSETEATHTAPSETNSPSETEQSAATQEPETAVSDGAVLETEDQVEMKPRDAVIKTFLSADVMTGFVFVFPPLFGGKPIDSDALADTLKKGKIVYGIDTEHTEQIVNNQQCMQIHIVAQGLLPVAGTDGKIIDHISRVEKINVMEDDRGQVDFKQLNIIQNIKKGDPICTLVPPIPGINGQNVSGKVIPCAKTVMPKTPSGNNTVMSSDGTQLLAAMDGFASFQYDRFNVENKLVVSGSVDNSVGNINFIGDVYVRGDVLNGFEVRAGGDIHVAGMVEGAFLYAGKNVTIDKGMNGNKQGSIVAGGEVNCRFLENCTIHAVGSVKADSMVWCDITSDDSIIASSGKGAIIGGSIVARNTVTAQVIGNKSHQKTNITLGYSHNTLTERDNSEKELVEAKSTLDTLTKNITYLSKLTGLSPEKQELLNQLIHQKRLYEIKKKALLNRLAELDNEISDFSTCHVDGDMIFPPTQITIGNASRTISNVWFKCHVYYADGEIKFGTAMEQ